MLWYSPCKRCRAVRYSQQRFGSQPGPTPVCCCCWPLSWLLQERWGDWATGRLGELLVPNVLHVESCLPSDERVHHASPGDL